MAIPAKLFADLPDLFAPGWDPHRPWELLDRLDEVLAEIGETSIRCDLPDGVHLAGEGIVLEEDCRIAPGATLHGPLFVGAGSELRAGCYIRGGSWIGPGCNVGASTEVKHSILLREAKAPHLNYVGDSVLGSAVNLGAGTVLSNFRHDGQEIGISHVDERVATGRRKLGAVLGDGVQTGCNSVLFPGTIVGAGTEIYPGVQLRSGVYPADHIIKLHQSLEIVEKRPDD